MPLTEDVTGSDRMKMVVLSPLHSILHLLWSGIVVSLAGLELCVAVDTAVGHDG